MTSQVIVNIDTKLKNRAMKKAKNEGTTLSAVLKSSIRAFALGEIDFGLKEKFNAKTRREVEEALRDIAKGKNLSPRFSSAAEAIRYLES